ncbi:MAG: DUF697 domain-containing protein [Actinobacteria bacterium]|nr:MAG: DUF697 domain-containing protein [Actinomycetota bacterium]
MAKLPVKATAVWGVLKEVRAATEDFRPLLLGGAASVIRDLKAALLAGGDPSAVRDLSNQELTAYDLEGARVLVWAIEGEPSDRDEAAFRLADRKDVDVVCLLVTPDGRLPEEDLPFVEATNVVVSRPGEPPPGEEIARRVAELDEDKNYALAAKLPAVRKAVCEQIVYKFARQNGIIGVAVFIPGADLPVLTLNQIRMVLRLAAAYGQDLDRERALDLVAVLGAGFGLRAVARELLDFVPVAGWAVKGAIAYAGTRALGEAAIRYFEAGGARGIAGAATGHHAP